VAVLAAKTNADIISDTKSTQNELKNGKSLQTKRTRKREENGQDE
jgi:hypothetical protein